MNETTMPLLPTALELPGYAIRLDAKLIEALNVRASFIGEVQAATKAFAALYDQLGNVKSVIRAFNDSGHVGSLFEGQVKNLVADLVEQDILSYTPTKFFDEFLELGGLDPFLTKMEEIEEQYMAIHADEAERDEIRRMRQASRFQVVGGGFGIGGAAKGIATAAAVNMGTAAVVGAFNLAGKAMSSVGNKMKEGGVYRDSKAELVSAFYASNLNLYFTYYGILDEELDRDFHPLVYLEERSEAASDTFENYETLDNLPPAKRLTFLVKCIENDPTEVVYFSELLEKYTETYEDAQKVVAFAAAFEPAAAFLPAFIDRTKQELLTRLLKRDTEGFRKIYAELGQTSTDSQAWVAEELETELLKSVPSLDGPEILELSTFVVDNALFPAKHLTEIRHGAEIKAHVTALDEAFESGDSGAIVSALKPMKQREDLFTEGLLIELFLQRSTGSPKGDMGAKLLVASPDELQRTADLIGAVIEGVLPGNSVLQDLKLQIAINKQTKLVIGALDVPDAEQACALFKELSTRLPEEKVSFFAAAVEYRMKDEVKKKSVAHKEAAYQFFKEAGPYTSKELKHFEILLAKATKGSGSLTPPGQSGATPVASSKDQLKGAIFWLTFTEDWKAKDEVRFRQAQNAWLVLADGGPMFALLTLCKAGLWGIVGVLVGAAFSGGDANSAMPGLGCLLFMGISIAISLYKRTAAKNDSLALMMNQAQMLATYHEALASHTSLNDKVVLQASTYMFRTPVSYMFRHLSFSFLLLLIPVVGWVAMVGILIWAFIKRNKQKAALQSITSTLGAQSSTVQGAA